MCSGCQSEEHFMNMKNHFYITLLSNAPQGVYPDNTVGEFTVQLAQAVELGNDKWAYAN